jgi:hypothetical protein
MAKTSSKDYCLIIRSNLDSDWQDTEGQSYQYGQTVPRYTRIKPGIRFIMDRREGANVVLVGHGRFGIIGEDGVDQKGHRRFRAQFETFTSFPKPKALPHKLRQQIAQQPGFNQQHAIREVPPELHDDLVAFGMGSDGMGLDNTVGVLDLFCNELKNLRMDRSSGRPKLYKPLMMLAAARTLVEGGSLSFGAPLLDHYRVFSRAVGEDENRPEYPYYHLQSEGFWTVLDAEGRPLQTIGRPTISDLRNTTAHLEHERARCIHDPAQRIPVLQTLLNHFNPQQATALAEEWPELRRFVPEGRMPSVYETSEALRLIHAHITTRGFRFSLQQIAAFYCALRTKPFVILAGISGTGKTRLPRLFAEAIGAELRQEAVRPDWADSADLIGYRDLKERFRPGRLLAFARQATESPGKSHFFVLDEMNLARVEHYLADVLSKIESRRREGDRVVTDWLVAPEELNDDPAALVWRKIGLPDNLFVIGTVNMDETTHGFSRKVLDRAFTLEFSEVDLHYISTETESNGILDIDMLSFDSLKPLALTLMELYSDQHRERCDRVIDLLSRVNLSLQKAQLQVGYRVRDEVCLFICHASEVSDIFPEDTALDYALCAKILPRIHGGAAALQDIMLDLLEIALRNNGERTVADIKEIITEVRRSDRPLPDLIKHRFSNLEAFQYPMTAAKLFIMLERLDRDGYTSYWL